MLAVIDYGAGNLRSVEKAFATVGVDARVSDDLKVLAEARGLVLPGVGAFGDACKELEARGYKSLILQRVSRGVPLLGVCLGYQLLFEESEEFGVHRGLGLLKGRVVRFPENELRVPHVGWNRVARAREHPLFEGIEENAFFYFVHSYYVEPADPALTIGVTEYGLEFASMAGDGLVMGVQFHPEKSQHAGLRLLKNFAAMVES